jgi:hypothetical protein
MYWEPLDVSLGERISLDQRLVIECASIPKSHIDTESDFVLCKPTIAILVSCEQAFESISIYSCKSGARVGN